MRSRYGRLRPKRERRPDPETEAVEQAPLPPKAKGDQRTVVEVDNPDDVDLYRHDGPPPGFTRAKSAPPVKREKGDRTVSGPPLEEFKSVLVRAVGLAKGAGLSEDVVAGLTARIGDFLTRFADPADREQRLLRELWEVAGEEEQRTLARLIARMAADEKPPVRH